MINDDSYIVRALQAGVPLKIIASKLNTTPEQVEKRWKEIMQDIAEKQDNGYLALSEAFHTLAGQYQLQGESLKIIAGALGNVMRDDEIRKLITTNPEETLRNLKANSIIFRPFIPVTPEESLQKTLSEN